MKKHLSFILAALAIVSMLIFTGCEADPVSVSSISLNKTELSLVLGSTARLEATTSPSNATVGTGITWSSENAEIASVDNDGNVTSESLGETIITAKTDNGKEAKCTVKVNPVITTGISFEKSTMTIERTAEPFKVNVVFTPSNTTDKSVSWSSSKQEVATVSTEGLITPVATGTTVIKAVHGKFEAEFTLEIVDVINEAGKLKAKLTSKDLLNTKSLRVSGSLNDTDYATIYYLANLTDLDLKLTDSTDMKYINPKTENLILPANMTTIAAQKFYSIPLKSIELPEGLTTIGDYAFWKTQLTSISIPGTVTTFGAYPFYECTKLATVNFGEGITEIPAWILSDMTSITRVSLPSSLKTIGAGAISGTAITEITIPDSVTTIGEAAFQQCTQLTSLTIPENVTAIPDNMCWNATGLANLSLPSTLQSIGKWAFLQTSLTSLTVPDSVTSIGEQAFYGCKQLATVVLGAGLTTIEPNTFYEAGITSLTFSASPDAKLTTIKEGAFSNIPVTELNLPDKITSIGNFAFQGCYGIQELHLPSELNTIGNFTFLDCKNLKTVNLPDKLTSIGEEAFSQCPLVFKDNILKMPANLQTIGENAFGMNKSIKALNLNGKLTTINEGAFLWLDGLTEVTIPASVTKMTDAWPTKLTKMTFLGTTPPELIISTMKDSEGVIKPQAPNRTWMPTALVNVPLGSEETYKNSTWFKGDQYKETFGDQHIPCFAPENVNKK